MRTLVILPTDQDFLIIVGDFCKVCAQRKLKMMMHSALDGTIRTEAFSHLTSEYAVIANEEGQRCVDGGEETFIHNQTDRFHIERASVGLELILRPPTPR